MSYRVGDYVRIRAPHELRGHRIQGGSAIDKWQNRICVVEEIRPTIAGARYKLALYEPDITPGGDSCCGVYFYEYLWEEYELDLAEVKEIQEDTYEKLIGGIPQ